MKVFSISLKMKGGMTLYVTKERSGPDHLIKIGKRVSKERSLFVMDERT